MDRHPGDNVSLSEEYRNKTAQSGQYFETAGEVLAEGIGGSAPTFDPYPFFVDSAEGSRITDVDGNEYLDFNLCWGVLQMGHAHPELVDGLSDQLAAGTMYGFPHEEAIAVATEITQRFGVDKVRFTNSGSESNLYAIRLARHATGKSKIIKVEGAYHGISSSLHVSKAPDLQEAGPTDRPSQHPYGRGIPEDIWKHTHPAPFNDATAIEALLEEHQGEVAAVILEPVMMNAGVVPPEEGYLDTVRQLTAEHNVPLIFDEVKTGLKIAPGGATEYYGVQPDLVALGKVIGAGTPLGAIAGREAFIQHIGEEGLFGTYSGNPLSIRASKIALEEILVPQAYDAIDSLAEQLYDGYADLVEEFDIEATVQAVGPTGGPIFSPGPVRNYRDFAVADQEVYDRYWLGMLNEGVVPMAYGTNEQALISTQHTEEEIERHLEAFKAVAPEL